jgi:hypothetical protein
VNKKLAFGLSAAGLFGDAQVAGRVCVPGAHEIGISFVFSGMNMDDLRERIIEECTPDVDGWALKLVDQRLSPTSDLVIEDQVLNYQGGVAIGTSVGMQVLGIGAIVLICSFIADACLEGGDGPGRMFPVVFLALAVIAYFIQIKIKLLHQKIRIDRKGITLREIEHEWQNVYDTFIFNPVATAGGRRRSRSFIVVVEKDGSIEQREITYLAVSRDMLATVIEYFKPK